MFDLVPVMSIVVVAVLAFLVLTAAYWVVRIGVRDGVRDADARRVRDELGLAPKRSRSGDSLSDR